jgi:ribosomal protein L37E
MDAELLRQFLADGLSTRQIAAKLDVSQTTVVYWINQHHLRPKEKRTKQLICRACGETDPSKFYNYRKKLCAACDNERVKARGAAQKQRVIELLGGKCCKCGYNKFACSLDVHHLDPSKKDPLFKNMRYWSWERTVEELKNCILVCRNCHAAIHHGDIE